MSNQYLQGTSNDLILYLTLLLLIIVEQYWQKKDAPSSFNLFSHTYRICSTF